MPDGEVNTPQLKRRDFFRIAGGAALSFPYLLTQFGCAPAVVDTPDPATGLSLGYTAGEVTMDGATVWLRAAPDSAVAVQYGKDPSLRQFSATNLFKVREDSDHTVQIALEGLDPSSIYYYRGAVAGRTPGPIARFVTAPRSDDLTKVRFCFSGDTRENYKPFTVMDAVRAQQPDFFLHLGDTIYADRGGIARRLGDFWAKYRANRDDAATQRCFMETSFYVMWDDHEVEDDFLPDHPLAPVGRKAFLDYWPIGRGVDAPDRIYRSFRWGRALELFVLDARQYRDPHKGTMLGKEQKSWLFSGLGSTTALFKFVATPVPMYGGGRDRWDGYSKERAELLRFIKQKKIRGVVFLSADLHYAAVSKIPGGDGLKDITAGPLAAPVNRITDGGAAHFEYFSAEMFNFAKVTVDPNLQPAHALVEFFDQDNRLMHRTKINAG